MSGKKSQVVGSTIENIFTKNNSNLAQLGRTKTRRKVGKVGPSKHDLELATTVLLVDLASCDQSFDPEEYHVITAGLMRLFGTGKSGVTALVNQAQLTLKNMRGVTRYANLLKENLSTEDKKAVLEVIEDVIAADGHEDGFETYLRHKFADMLGTTPEQSKTERIP